MAYKKFLLDNVTCNRRFHVMYDDDEKVADKTSVSCDYCGVLLMEKKDHPPIKMIRDEIIIKTTKLSSHRTKGCQGEDFYPPKDVP